MNAGVSVVGVSGMPVGWLLWQRAATIPVLTVVCRATFSLQPGEAVPAPRQEPISPVERPYPDGRSRGLYAPSDLVPLKPRADIVLVGSAHALGGQPVRSLIARLTVGEVDKRIEIFSDRHVDSGGVLREGPPFTSMPIVYERSAGGPDTPNPVGVGARATDGRALPNLQPPGAVAPTTSPVGFGPIASDWPARAALLGPTLGARPPGEWNGQLVPADLDPAFFNVAPRDQQVSALREDELIVLENLHPVHARLATRLPGVRPQAFVEGRGPAPQPVAMRADTLWIDAAGGVATLTWRGQVLLDRPDQGVRVLVATAPRGRTLSWEEVERMQRELPSPSHEEPRAKAPPRDPWELVPPGMRHFTSLTGTQMPSDVPTKPALPFAPKPSAPASESATAPAATASPRDPWELVPPGMRGFTSLTGTQVPSAVPSQPVLPFAGPVTTPAPEAGAELAPAPVQVEAAPPPPPAESPWARAGASALAQPVTALPSVPVLVAKPAPRVAPAAPLDALGLVGFDPGVLPRVRRDPRFAPLLEALGDQPLDPDLDEPEAAEPAADVEDRREVFEVLARGAASGEEEIAAALAEAVRDDGRLVHPVVLVAGELRFPFDEVESLKAALSAAAPHAGEDEEAGRTIALGRELLRAPGPPAAAASAAEGLVARLRETFEKRGLVAAGYVDAQSERALLGGRHFQQRTQFGGPHRRALLPVASEPERGAAPKPSPTATRPAIPVYIPGDIAARLPAAQRLRARMLAFVHPAVDEKEPSPLALRAVAIAIVTTPSLRR